MLQQDYFIFDSLTFQEDFFKALGVNENTETDSK